jgi:hemin uptake protein HemP
MNPQTPSGPRTPGYYPPPAPRQRVSTTGLTCGSRELVVLHEGEEYILRITRTGKLIITK